LNSQTGVGEARRHTWLGGWGNWLRALLSGLLFWAGTVLILLLPTFLASQPYRLQVGDIAPEDIRAPRDITYISQSETQAARDAARASISDVYDSPDPRVGRQQVRKARQIKDFIAVVRADSLAGTDLKESYLNVISGLTLTSDESLLLLSTDDATFEQITNEAISLLEEAMSGPVREGRVDEVTSRLALMVSSDFPEPLIPLILSITSDLVIPNSSLNMTKTEAARLQAEEAVPDVQHTFQQGEVIVRAGDLVDEQDMEAMVASGLTVKELTWQDIAGAAIAGLLSLVVLVTYLVAFKPPWVRKFSHTTLAIILFLLFLLLAQFMVTGQEPVAYLFPAAALALALHAFAGIEFTALAMIVMAGLVGYLAHGSFEMAVITAAGSLLAAGNMRRSARLSVYFVAGIAAALGGAAAFLIFYLPSQVEPSHLIEPLLFIGLNGLLSTGIALVILFAVGSLFGMTTNLQLIDLMRPDHPLQRQLQQVAVGTYQHTLEVANLVEAAAEAIQADSLLARVGTLYHDIGKATNPGFFVENRIEGGPDPHEELSPAASARIIKAHVKDGVTLARRHRLPSQIIAFVVEHHGTLPMLYFLNKAQQEAAASGVDIEDASEFYYNGPAPRSRETAILMLADGCESAVRAIRPVTTEDIEKTVDKIIKQRIDLHQLDDSGLTLTDIKTIQDTFVRALKGMYHPRIKYPGDEKPGTAPSQPGTG
jgi:putative nucleotidyltransferase with HDIG domain